MSITDFRIRDVSPNQTAPGQLLIRATWKSSDGNSHGLETRCLADPIACLEVAEKCINKALEHFNQQQPTNT